MGEILHILSPQIDRNVVCETLGIKPASREWTSLSWKDGKAKMQLDAFESGKEFKEVLSCYQQLFENVAEGADLKEIKRRLLATKWLLRITASPDFDATAADSNSIASLAMQLDGTCITSSAVIDPATGDAILAWDSE